MGQDLGKSKIYWWETGFYCYPGSGIQQNYSDLVNDWLTETVNCEQTSEQTHCFNQMPVCCAKSDKISKMQQFCINLLFECVKIVEFNLISYVFLVMYQEIRLLNQDAHFLDQEERLQFLISSVSKRDWKRAHRLEFKMVSNPFYIPNANVCSPFCSSAGTVWTKIPMGGTQNFLQDV